MRWNWKMLGICAVIFFAISVVCCMENSRSEAKTHVYNFTETTLNNTKNTPFTDIIAFLFSTIKEHPLITLVVICVIFLLACGYYISWKRNKNKQRETALDQGTSKEALIKVIAM